MNSFVLENSVNGSPNNYLGFVNLPNQVHRKSVKKGFEFTLMVVGESGLGKSTLINSLFLTKLYKNRELLNVEEKLEKTIDITTQQVDVEEKGVKLKLTVVDTPGYGDNLNNKGSIEPIVKYIDYQFEKYLDYENGLNRRNMIDTRVHCCFYFISPISYGLKPLDIEFMKQLHTKVNIIPIIAKADSLTKDEVAILKKRILSEIQKHEICIYTIPDCDTDEDPEFLKQISEIKEAVPFAISSSIDKFEINGKPVYGRQYSFGVVEVENPEHSDFVKLRSMLVSHMQDLREVTNELHYENYRSMKLANGLQLNNNGLNDSSSISSSFHLDDEKDKILKKKEEELKMLQEKLEKMQEQMKMKIEA